MPTKMANKYVKVVTDTRIISCDLNIHGGQEKPEFYMHLFHISNTGFMRRR